MNPDYLRSRSKLLKVRYILCKNQQMKLYLFILSTLLVLGGSSSFDVRESTIDDIRLAFSRDALTSHHLVTSYLNRIQALNPSLRAILEVNPDALEQASTADRERLEARRSGREGELGPLHGIPVLLKDSIGTLDRMNTTCGSYALLGAKVARDAHVVERLRNEGAVLLGKASLSEWYHMRSSGNPNGWSARGGQGVNPYASSADPCGSSSGSAIAVAANMVAVSLGSETHGSIICPSDHNSVVGFKPTAGLTSRSGIIPVSPSVDSIGPIARTVSDAVHVLDAIVGVDPRDEATEEAAKYVPAGGYRQFLKEDGLRGKRLGVVRQPFFASFNGTTAISTFEEHLVSIWKKGAIVMDNLEIANVDVILDPSRSGEMSVMLAEFRRYLNDFLVELRSSPVRSLAEIIAFNKRHPDLEKTLQYDQDGLIAAEAARWDEEEITKAKEMMRKLSEEGFEKLMKENELDAMVTLGVEAVGVMAMEGYPAITVPAGYNSNGKPFGMFFGGLKGSEPKLIEIAYAFEQATMARRPPFSYSSVIDSQSHYQL